MASSIGTEAIQARIDRSNGATARNHRQPLKVAMVEIADKFLNKISTYVTVGEAVRPGQKVSFIERGSQVDLFLFAEDVEFLVGVGDQVYGAQTAIAQRSAGQ